MIKRLVVIFMLMACSVLLRAETKIVELPGLGKPEAISVDKTQMYITEGTSIYIYSQKDFKLLKKIGKTGEGPQEFIINPQLGGLVLDVTTDELIVNSFGKLSWFSKDGTFKKELKLPYAFILNIQPFGKNLIGTSFNGSTEQWRTLNLYDDKLKTIKEIARIKHSFQLGKGLQVLPNTPSHAIHGGKLFLAWEDGITIKVLDSELKELFTIKHPYQKQKFTEEDKEAVLNSLKTDPRTKDILEILKPIQYPDYFPAIMTIVGTGNKLYCITFTLDKDKKYETLIFGLNGKLEKKVYIPFLWEKPLKPYPLDINEGKMYQLADNADTEEWELHITEIK